MPSTAPVVLVLGPHRAAVSGVSTHINLLFASRLARSFALTHFQVGSEGRREQGLRRWLRLIFSPVALAVEILRKGARIVHLNSSLNPRAYWRDMVYLLVAKVCGARSVYQIHGGALPLQFAAANPLAEPLLRTSLGLPDAIVVLAESELTAYQSFLPGQVVAMLPNGIDLSLYVPKIPPVADRAGALRLIYVGRLVREKGLFEALQGLALARALGTSATLLIVGSGDDEELLKAHVQHHGLDDVVRFVGAVFGEDKRHLYEQADALLFPTHAEGLPYALLEGMAAGLPAITTRVGAIPDVMVGGVHGLFVPPHDEQAIARAISCLAHDRPLLAAMSAACQRRIAQRYSIERLANDFSRLYAEIRSRRHANVLNKS